MMGRLTAGRLHAPCTAVRLPVCRLPQKWRGEQLWGSCTLLLRASLYDMWGLAPMSKGVNLGVHRGRLRP
jgi:hypothetical protein